MPCMWVSTVPVTAEPGEWEAGRGPVTLTSTSG